MIVELPSDYSTLFYTISICFEAHLSLLLLHRLNFHEVAL